MTRRDALKAAAGLALPLTAHAQSPRTAGRLKQSLARWCYRTIPIEDLCRQAAAMGITGIDLVPAADWPVCRKYGLTPCMVQGAGTIPDAWNRRDLHDKLEIEMRDNLKRAAEAKLPNVITFFGNRRGITDAEGMENCILGLNRVKKYAEDAGVTVCVEVLNSLVDHKDYQGDHTRFGLEVIKAVNSPRVRLLYDIYHMQIMEGNVIATIRENIQYIAHFHTGGVPGRHELDDTQELNWRTVALAIADLNFQGWVAHEFVPVRDPMTSLRQAVELCNV
jgi:hydroxypyruvate isomerase